MYKTESKNKGWDKEVDRSRDEPQPKSAGDNFVEQQQILAATGTSVNNQPPPRDGFGRSQDKKSRWESDTAGATARGFENSFADFQQSQPPALMGTTAPSSFFRGPGFGPRGLGNGPMGPRPPLGMGFGPRGPNGGTGLLGQVRCK